MTKKIFFAIIFVVHSFCLNAQVLYSENFDNYTVGYLGTDYKGQIPGKGGWYTCSFKDTQNNTPFTIVPETGKGKVLTITSPLASSNAFWTFKRNLNSLIDNRSAGNDVIKFEIDYFTGNKQNLNVAGNNSSIYILYNNDVLSNNREELAHLHFDKREALFNAGVYQDPGFKGFYIGRHLPFNTWIKINLYLDYPNKKVYLDIPYFGETFVGDFLKNSTSTNLLKDFPPSSISLHNSMESDEVGKLYYMVNKYDNIKITALNAVPPEVIDALSINKHLARQFNLYPNPATNVVNISNAENIQVNQITIYDFNGKQLSMQSFNNEADIKLNVENLSSGTYMLHLQTNEGTAVKKLLKK